MLHMVLARPGSAKATQEADAVIILQNDGMVKYLDVRKNRFDGDLGVVPLNVSVSSVHINIFDASLTDSRCLCV